MNRSDLRNRLVNQILGDELGLTSAEVVEKGGLTLDAGQRLWRALGFPDTGDSIAYGEADVLELAKASENVQKFLEGFEIVKEIYVPGKLVNLAVRPA